MVGERVYRALVYLYPRSFRREYGPQMLQLYRDARRDRVASWPQLAGDLVLTAPRQHQEAFMNLETTHKLGLAGLVLTTGIVVFLVLGGAMFALALALLLAWTLTAYIKQGSARMTGGTWWKLGAAGLGLLALIFVVFAPPWPESWRSAVPEEVGYWTVIFGVIFAIVLVTAGILSGIVVLVARRHATR